MMKRNIHIIVILVFGYLISIPPASAFRNINVGDNIKSLKLETIDRQTVELTTGEGEKASIIFFWALWSPRSHDALSEYQNLFDDYSDKGLQVVGINAEHEEIDSSDRAKISSALAEKGIEYPNVVDEGLVNYSRLGVSVLPSTMLVDGQGNVVEVLTGYAPFLRDTFREKVESVLGLAKSEPEAANEAPGYRPKGKAARYFAMAKLFVKKHQVKRALKSLEKALEEDPDFEDARELLKELESKQDQP